MAIARCGKHGEEQDTKLRYPHPHPPHADRLLCGSPKCARPALVWLSDAEEHQYRHTAVRTFSVIRYRSVEVE